jgi:hypothetical protein
LARYAPSCREPDVTCRAKVNSLGCTPAISWTGSPSASQATPFRIEGSGVLNQSLGLLVYGRYGPDARPFQGGWLCVAPPLARTAPQSSGGHLLPMDCSGSLVFEFNDHIASGADPALGLGQEVWAQYWYRDPASSNSSGLTDALHFTICR